jgi:hypothetical protein
VLPNRRLRYLRRRHHVSSDAAVYLLQKAMSSESWACHFNDRRCRSVAELRPYHRGPRPRAWRARKKRKRAPEAVARWFRAALDGEHIARVAAGDDRSKFILRPPVPAGTAPVEIEQGAVRCIKHMRPGDAPICERNPRFESHFLREGIGLTGAFHGDRREAGEP